LKVILNSTKKIDLRWYSGLPVSLHEQIFRNEMENEKALEEKMTSRMEPNTQQNIAEYSRTSIPTFKFAQRTKKLHHKTKVDVNSNVFLDNFLDIQLAVLILQLELSFLETNHLIKGKKEYAMLLSPPLWFRCF